MGEAMSDDELIATLFISDEGEISELAGFAGKAQVTYQFPRRRNYWADPYAAEAVDVVQIAWKPISALPEPVQKAIVTLYRERAEAQELALGWFHEWANGLSGVPSPNRSDLWHRARELEARLKEKERR